MEAELIRVRPHATKGAIVHVGHFVKPYPEILAILGKPDRISNREYRWCYFLIPFGTDAPIPLEIQSIEKDMTRRKMTKWVILSTEGNSFIIGEQVKELLQLRGDIRRAR